MSNVLCLCPHPRPFLPLREKKKKQLLRDLCQSDLPLCLFSHPLLTLAPQESASPSGQSPQIWCGGAANCLSACLRYNNKKKYFLKVTNCSQLKKPRTSANVRKQDVCFWLSYLHLFFFFFHDSLHLSDTYYRFVRPVICCVKLSQEKQLGLCRHLPVFHWYFVPFHRSSSSFMLPSKLTTSDSVVVFLFGLL